jgi:ribonuclease HI
LDLTVVVHVDGLAMPTNPGVATYGYIIDEDGKTLAEGSGLAGENTTSNFAEYSALVEALKKLKELKVEGDILVRSDSKLLVGQMSQGWKVKGGAYAEKLKEARTLLKEFGFVTFEWIPREQNEEADLLTRIAYEKHKNRGS